MLEQTISIMDKGVPTTISIVAGKIITISVDDKKTDWHFAWLNLFMELLTN